MTPHHLLAEYANAREDPLRLFRQPLMVLLMFALVVQLPAPNRLGAIYEHQSGPTIANQPRHRSALAQALLTRIGGAAQSVAMHKTTALVSTWSFATTESTLRFINAADAARPVEMAQWKLSVTALAMSGDYAYAIETALFQPRSTLLPTAYLPVLHW